MVTAFETLPPVFFAMLFYIEIITVIFPFGNTQFYTAGFLQ
jgi:hypothetical protein